MLVGLQLRGWRHPGGALHLLGGLRVNCLGKRLLRRQCGNMCGMFIYKHLHRRKCPAAGAIAVANGVYIDVAFRIAIADRWAQRDADAIALLLLARRREDAGRRQWRDAIRFY